MLAAPALVGAPGVGLTQGQAPCRRRGGPAEQPAPELRRLCAGLLESTAATRSKPQVRRPSAAFSPELPRRGEPRTRDVPRWQDGRHGPVEGRRDARRAVATSSTPIDLSGVLGRGEELAHQGRQRPVYGLSDVLASCAKDHAVVAVIGDEVVGAAIGRAAHAQGWVVFLATAAHVRGTGIGSSMLAALEARMAAHGISKMSALMPAAETRVGAFLHQGFVLKQDLHYFERHIPVQREELKILGELGGRVLPRGPLGRWSAG